MNRTNPHTHPHSTLSRLIPALTLLALLLAAAAAPGPVHAAPASGPQFPPGPAAPYLTHFPLLLEPAPPPTSEQLIDEALARGDINAETALTYKVFAAFGDERLPARFRGAVAAASDNMIVAELELRFDGLSLQAQQMLAPFLLPPSAPGSWLELREAATHADGPLPSSPAIVWGKIPAAEGKALVWYQADRYPGDVVRAQSIAKALSDKIWPQLTILMGREPPSDLGHTDNGGDGRFDIYLVRGIGRLGIAGRYWPYCKEVPSYLLIYSDYDADILKVNVAHEFMHALQWSYRTKTDCVYPGEYAWMAEATANWAEDFVYPEANWEQTRSRSFLNTPELPLEVAPADESYKLRWEGAYLFPFFLTHKYAPSLIRTVWENTEKVDSLEAWDMSIPGGFEQQWPDFVLHNVNRPPVNDYDDWDELKAEVRSSPKFVDMEGREDRAITLEMWAGVQHLAAKYHHLYFVDDSVRSVVFYNGFNFRLSEQQVNDPDVGPVGTTLVASPLPAEEAQNAHVTALIKTAGHDWAVEDWTDKGLVRYCRDAPGERLEELILMFSNSAHKDRQRTIHPFGLPPTLWVSNIGCWRWEGDISSVEHVFDNGALLTMEANVRFQRTKSSAWPLTANKTGEWLTHDDYEPIGTLKWRFSGIDNSGCTWSGSGDLALSEANSWLSVASYVKSGDTHRSYSGFGETDELVVIGRNHCPDGTGGPYGWHTWWFPAWPGAVPGQPTPAGTRSEFTWLHVAPTGAIEDSIDYHSGLGQNHASWRLTAQSAP